jgi:uncharacterized membrane protein
MTAPDAPQPQSPAQPPAFTLWTLRILALSGLGVALFLTGIHIIAALKAERVRGPYCRILSFFDCDTVLNSEWGAWFGIPVPVLGALPYAALAVMLFARRRPWWPICAMTAIVAAAAGWFIYLQLAVLDRTFCLWCMVEHTIGLTLFALTWLVAFGAGALRGLRGPAALAVAALPVAVLIVGQHLDTHVYTAQAGAMRLSTTEHMMVGAPGTPRVAVEAIDYTCPRCRRLAGLTRQVRQIAGPSIAFLIITVPLHPTCNSDYAQQFGGEVEPRHRHACQLAELAHAVWLAAPSRFEEFHEWLFDHQDELREDPTTAHEKAAELVGAAALDHAVNEVRATRRLQRDVKIATEIGVGQLPGLFAGDKAFVALPEDPDTLLQLLLMVFGAESQR